MTQRDDFLNDADLETLFEQARGLADNAPLSDSFMARVLTDADAQQDAMGAGIPTWAQPPNPTQLQVATPASKSWVNVLLDFVGGWRGGAGLTSAAVMGLAIGLGAPTMVTQLTLGTWTTATISDTGQTTSSAVSYALDDLVPSFYDLAAEG